MLRQHWPALFSVSVLFFAVPALAQPNFDAAVLVPGQVNPTGTDEWYPRISVDAERIYYLHDRLSGSGAFNDLSWARKIPPYWGYRSPEALTIQGAPNPAAFWIAPDELTVYVQTQTQEILRAERTAIGESFANPITLDVLKTTLGAASVGSPSLTDDEMRIVFGADGDLYEADRPDTASAFGNIRALTSLNSAADETHCFLSGDGREIYFISRRAGGEGDADVYYSRRASAADPFPAPSNVLSVNTAQEEWGPSYHPQQRLLYFSRHPYGQNDLRNMIQAPILSLAIPDRTVIAAGGTVQIPLTVQGSVLGVERTRVELACPAGWLSFAGAGPGAQGGTVTTAWNAQTGVLTVETRWGAPVAGDAIELAVLTFAADPSAVAGERAPLEFTASTGGPEASGGEVTVVAPVSLDVAVTGGAPGSEVRVPIRAIGFFHTGGEPITLALAYNPSLLTPVRADSRCGGSASLSAAGGLMQITLSGGAETGNGLLLADLVVRIADDAAPGSVAPLDLANGSGGPAGNGGAVHVNDAAAAPGWPAYR